MKHDSNSAVESQPAEQAKQAESTEQAQPQLSGRMGVIYKITCLVNGKSYVGQTRQKLNRRIIEHKRDSSRGRPGIDAAIAKYGWENFTAEIIEECPVELLNEREIFWIAKLNTKVPNGYNLTDGGDNSLNPSDETRAKISANHADFSGEKNGFYGEHHSEETRAKISAAKKGKPHKPHSPETCAKIAASNKGKHSQNKGKHLSEEHRAKIAVARKAFWARKKLEEQNNS
ncbi:MAG: GIY-YIG nuclease family protein [Selenomonadaceae bacterium]|nr:GIY-YIG nuclease family protein [Selenomonadaceae bacterium]